MYDTIQLIPPADIAPSPFNPRKHLGDVTELAESIRSVGIQQPLVIRRVAGKPELVFGHRRREGAIVAGADVVPCIEREYSDDEVIEVQIIENLQREDVHPLDEADAFVSLRDRGMTITEIGAKVGRTPKFVAQRISMARLGVLARKVYDAGYMTIEAAAELAALPTERMQSSVIRSEFGDWEDVDTQAMSDDESDWGHHFEILRGPSVRRFIRSNVLVPLKAAPFARDTSDLGAPACTSCPKRSSAQAVLFDDLDATDDHCLDPECYGVKVAAQFELIRGTAARVLEGEAGDRAAQNGWEWSRLDGKVFNRQTRSEAKVRAIVEKHDLPVTLVHAPMRREILEVVDAEAVRKAMREDAGVAMDSDTPDSYQAHQRQRAKRQKVLNAAHAEVIRLAHAAEDVSIPLELVHVLWLALLDESNSETRRVMGGALGIVPEMHQHYDQPDWETTFRNLFACCGPDERTALIRALLVASRPLGYGLQDDAIPALQERCHLFEIDVQACVKEAEVAAKPKAKSRKKAAV